MFVSSSGLHVHVVSDVCSFDQMKQEWVDLQTLSQDRSIFMTWDCQRLWWKHYGKGRRLSILAAREGTALVGLLPLYIEHECRAGGLWRVRKLRQVGLGGDTAPDDLSALLHPDHQERAAGALVEFLLREMPCWDVLDFADLPAGSPLVKGLLEQLPKAGLRVECRQSAPIVYGTLPQNFDVYRQSLGAHRRKRMSQKRRKFDSQPGSRFAIVSSETELDAAFDELVRLHRLRWSDRTAYPAFSSQEFRGFHREWMRAMLAQGQLRLLSLELEQGPVAMLYCMVYKRQMNFFQGGFDPAYSQFGPGDVLISRAIEQAIVDGCEIFDMLKGDHDYKRHFFQLDRSNLAMRAFKRGRVDAGYRLFDALRRLRRRLRERGLWPGGKSHPHHQKRLGIGQAAPSPSLSTP
jgi:CelD/BcsL family acetyltransferase involved in cellulose biosynthesis